jgi:hypothetical protein
VSHGQDGASTFAGHHHEGHHGGSYVGIPVRVRRARQEGGHRVKHYQADLLAGDQFADSVGVTKSDNRLDRQHEYPRQVGSGGF